MAIQTAQLIRIAADETKFETPKDINTGEAVKWYKGNNLQFQVGVFNGDSIVASVTNLAELRLVVKALGSGGGAPPDTDAALMSLDQATIDGTVIQDTWDDGTKQHAVFDFTDAESNIAAGDVWLAIMAKTTDATAKWKTVAAGLVTVLEDAIPTSGQTISPQTGFVRTNSTIIGLIGGTATDFDSLVTVNGTIPTGAVYLITVGGIQYVYELTVGTDAESSPTVIRPDDYAASTNEVVWKLLEIQAFELALIQENTPADPTLSFGEDDGFYSEADDFISVATNGARRFFWNNDIYGANNANGPAMLNEAATNTNPPFAPDRSDDDTGYSIGPSVNELAAVCGGVEAMRWQANAVFIPEYLSHLNDGNTEMRLRDDQVTIYAGGVALIDAQETTQDILKLGDTAGGGDVDINFNNGQGLLRGSDGFWKIGGDGNIDQRLHIEGSTSVEAIRIETTAVNGNAQLILDNDAQQWIIETAGDNSDRLIIRDQTQGHDRFQFRTDGWIEFFGQTLDAYMLFDTNKVNGQCRIDWTNDAQTWSLYGVDSSDNFHIRDVTNAQDVLTITDGDGTVNANVGDIRVSAGNLVINRGAQFFLDGGAGGDTYLQSSAADKIIFVAGGTAFCHMHNTTQDLLSLGDVSGGGDVDINFNNGQGLLRGSDGFWKIGGDGNIDQRLHIEGSTSVEAIRIETTAVNGNAQLILDNDAQQWIIETAGDNSDRLIIRDQTQGHDRFQFRTDGWIEFFGQTLDAYMLFDTNKVNGQCRIDWTNDAQTWSLYGVDSSDNFHIRDVTNAQDVLTITDGDGTVNANVGDIRVSAGNLVINQGAQFFLDGGAGGDTYLQSSAADKIIFVAGGTAFCHMHNTTQDLLSLGDVSGGGDVDINFNNGQMLLTGSDGVLQLATTTNGNLEILKAEIQTTDATVTTLFSVAVANDSAVHFEINVVAIEVTDHDETASYQRIVTIQNDGGVLSVIGSVSAPHTAEVTASWDIPLALRAPNVLVRVSGAAATIINWYGTIQKYKIA